MAQDANDWIEENKKESKDGEEWINVDEVKSYLSGIDDELRGISCQLSEATLNDVCDVLSSAESELDCLGGEICQ